MEIERVAVATNIGIGFLSKIPRNQDQPEKRVWKNYGNIDLRDIYETLSSITMSKTIFIFVLVLLIGGCLSLGGFVCESPYFQVGDECCLDEGQNNICDERKILTSTKPTNVRASGFGKIKPIGSTAHMNESGFFYGDFQNGVGARIEILSVSLGTDPNKSCKGVRAQSVNGTNFIESGEILQIQGENCFFENGQFNLDVVIEYEVSIDYEVPITGIEVPHNETGRVYGKVYQPPLKRRISGG